MEDELLGYFFEESAELLQAMEAALLQLDSACPEPSQIDAAFRAVHSIKGNCGPFGFTDLADFAHLAEALLEEARDGSRALTPDAVDALLATCDCLQGAIGSLRDHSPTPKAQLHLASERLRQLLGETPSPSLPPPEPTATVQSATAEWRIHFVPGPNILRDGNEPRRILRELASLGVLETHALTRGVPALEAIDPETCHLGWDLRLRTSADEESIREAFAWIEDECQLEITVVTPREPRAATPTLVGGAARGSMRVGTEKIDALLDMVGELVITQSMLGELGHARSAGDRALADGLSLLQRNVRDLQDSVMRIRMLPVRVCFDRLPRLVHELSRALNKPVDLVVSGEQTELDKSILEKLADPLVHLVRNAVAHGLESSDARRAAGKPPRGHVRVHARQEGGIIVIEVEDDGAGIDSEAVFARARALGLLDGDADIEDITRLLFRPGFSTAGHVTDVSGRGVGLDVVQRNISELGGAIRVDSEPGRGSTFSVRLPLTLAIVDGQLVRAGDQSFVIPSLSIVEFRQTGDGHLHAPPGGARLYRLDEQTIPVARLGDLVGQRSQHSADELLVVLESGGRLAGFFVDELLGQQQVVIKSVDDNYGRVPAVAGATVLGNGQVTLILDVPGLVELAAEHSKGTRKRHEAAAAVHTGGWR